MKTEQHKTKKQLLGELAVLRRRLAGLEKNRNDPAGAVEVGQGPSDALLVEQASDGIFVADAEGRFVDANTSGLQMVGYELDELLQIRIPDLVPDEDLELEPVHFDEYRRGKTVVVERRLRRKDGTLLPTEISTKMLPDGRLFSIVRDITERKRIEQALKQSHHKLRIVLERLPDGISLLVDGRVLFANSTLAAMYGYSNEEFLGKSPTDFLDLAEGSVATRRMKELLQGGAAYASEYNCRRADGTVFPAEITSRLIQLDDHPALLSVHRDLTERKRLERELLEVSERERKRIGHDLHDGLGQHLAGIAFLGKAMAQKLAAQSSPEAATATEIVKLVNQAMTQARHLARGLSPVALEVGGLKAALEDLGLNTELLFNVSCSVKAEEVLSTCDDVTARNIYYVAQEALTNAIKHGKANNLEVRLFGAEDRCMLTVRDDGLGFSENAETSTGMGLHIMRYRANMIHASFSIRPAPGGGTVVELSVTR